MFIKKLMAVCLIIVHLNTYASSQKLMIPSAKPASMATHIPLEMAQFYLALGVSEYWHCLQNDDPLSCSEYLQMMSDPISHLGFAMFMVTSRNVTHLGMKTKMTAPMASYLGLASGMLVQSVFEEIYRHPDMQDYLKTRYIEDEVLRAKMKEEALGRLYDKTFGDSQWYTDKIPLISSLLLAAGFSPIIVKAANTITAAGYKLLTSKLDTKKLDSFMDKERAGLNKFKQKVATKGIKIIFSRGKTTTLAPVIYIGEYLIMTLTFLEVHHILDRHISQYWAMSKAEKALNKAMKQTHYHVPNVVWDQDNKKALESLDKLEQEWDNYRFAQTQKAFSVFSRHLNSLEQIDLPTQSIFSYYLWISQGMDKKSEMWKKNDTEWHEHEYDIFKPESFITDNVQEQEDSYIESLFCASPLEESISLRLDFNGIPIPFKEMNLSDYKELSRKLKRKIKMSSYELRPFKMIDAPNTCEKDIELVTPIREPYLFKNEQKSLDLTLRSYCPVSFEDGTYIEKTHITRKIKCLNILKGYRKFILKNFINLDHLRSKVYETFQEEIPSLLEEYKDQKLDRYEKALKKEINSYLVYRNEKSSVLTSYEKELDYWRELLRFYPSLNNVLVKKIKTTKAELRAAKNLKRYLDGQEIKKDEDLFEEKTTWEDYWDGLILK